VLETLLRPIRERRAALAGDRAYVLDVVDQGTARARAVTDRVANDVRRAFALEPLPAYEPLVSHPGSR
jgi:tryptophanyl-tRNA synthetase